MTTTLISLFVILFIGGFFLWMYLEDKKLEKKEKESSFGEGFGDDFD